MGVSVCGDTLCAGTCWDNGDSCGKPMVCHNCSNDKWILTPRHGLEQDEVNECSRCGYRQNSWDFEVAAGLPAGSVDESRGPHPHAAARLVPNTCHAYQQANGKWRCSWVSAEGVPGRSKAFGTDDVAHFQATVYAMMLHTQCGYTVTT